jgi:hypothetical protein
MKRNIISPLAASRINSDKADFYTACPLREWALVKKIRQMTGDNVCGELCSLRFTWQQPKKDSSDEATFIYETLAGLIDAAWCLANAPLAILHIEQVPDKNNLFALAMFENEVVAEFELNECLPDSMPATHFIKANFKNGHITNQPLVGHFNEEGSILADDSAMERLVIENNDWDDCGDEIKTCERAMMQAIEQGTYPVGALHAVEIINSINFALGRDEVIQPAKILNIISKAV